MNIEYLTNEIIPQREKEIKEGRNACTNQPIYVVMDLIESFCSGHNEYHMDCNLIGIDCDHGYIDRSLDIEEQEFYMNEQETDDEEPITRFFIDKIVAFFLTRQAADEYMEYQKHNLSCNAYVYTFYSGYANRQMDKLLNGK